MNPDQENIEPNFSDDVILKAPEVNVAASLPTTPHPQTYAQDNNQGQISIDQLQAILTLMRPASEATTNPFFDAAEKIAKLTMFQSSQIPGVLTTYAS